MSTVVPIKGATPAPKNSQSRMETLILSSEQVLQFRVPPFQRPLRVNQKVLNVCEAMKRSQTIEGVLTLGSVPKDPTHYIVDGQHRIEAFKLSGLPEVIADVRFLRFDSMGDMADEFVRLNSSLVNMRPGRHSSRAGV